MTGFGRMGNGGGLGALCFQYRMLPSLGWRKGWESVRYVMTRSFFH